MEPNPRTPPGAHRLRSLNAPVAARLEVEAGLPRAVLLRGGWRRVARLEEVWRIDDGWWRPNPVARTYFRLAMEDGQLVTVYRDDLEATWWTQRY
jgi:hypothetical protein